MDFFRGTLSWRKFRMFLSQMPQTSRFAAGRAMDKELAEQALAAGIDGDQEKWTPPLTEWDLKSELLAQMSDRLAEVIKVLAAIKSGVPVVQQERLRAAPKINMKPFPRPVTAFEQVREEAAKAAAEQLIEWFFPHAKRR